MLKSVLITIVIFSLIIGNISQNQSTNTVLQCNKQTCPSNVGQCDINGNCICISPLYSLNVQNQFCNYKQVSRWVPFSIELLLPSGGFFYVGRPIRGGIKLIVLLLPILFSLIGYCIYDVKNPNKCWEIFTLMSFIIIFPAFLIDHVIDLSLFGMGYYYDGYGAPLL